MNIHNTCKSLLLTLMLAAAPAVRAGNTATVTISATVLADCSVTVNQNELNLGRVAVSNLKDKPANTVLDGMTGQVTVTSTCSGTNNAKLTVSAGAVADQNIVATSPSGNTDIMRFGLKINDKAAGFSDSGKSVTSEIRDPKLSSSGHTDTLTFSALAGKNASTATAGNYSSVVTVKVEPE